MKGARAAAPAGCGERLEPRRAARSARRWLLVALLPLALLVAVRSAGSNLDNEELEFSVRSTVLQAQALRAGELPWWNFQAGFGMPHPFGQSFLFHPALPLFAVRALRPVLIGFDALHLLIGALFLFAVARRLGARPPIAALGVVTFLLSSPTLNYFITDFWPSAVLAWGLTPVILYALLVVVGDRGGVRAPGAVAPRSRARWAAAVAAGALAGFIALNSAAPYAVTQCAGLGILVLAHGRRALCRWRELATCATVALLVSSHQLVHLVVEAQRFAPDTYRASYGAFPIAEQLWAALLHPLPREWAPSFLGLEPVALRSTTRRLFFGLPFLLLAVAGALRWRARRGNAGEVRETHDRDEVVAPGAGSGRALALAFGLLLLAAQLPPEAFLRIVSGSWFFRDNAVLFGILLACLALERGLAGAGARRRPGAPRMQRGLWRALAALQVVLLAAGAAPLLSASWHALDADSPYVSAAFYLSDSPLREQLREAERAHPGRFDLSWGVDRNVHAHVYRRDGFEHSTMARDGIPLVNGKHFKGISQRIFSPDPSFMYGRIFGQRSLARSAAGLDVLGIRHLLALPDEPVSASLVVDCDRASASGRPLRHYLNPGAWPLAVFVAPEACALRAADLPLLPEAEHRGLLARDLSALRDLRRQADTPIATRVGSDRIACRFASAESERWIFLSEAWREEWRVAVGEGAELVPILGAFIGVRVPAGIEEVVLEYRPRLRIGAFAASATALLAAAVAVALLVGRAHRARRRP